jgi:hypothetical protein
MQKLLLYSDAVIFATKKAMLLAFAMMGAGFLAFNMPSIVDIKTALGPSGVAALAAMVGVTARWFWFKLSFQVIWREYIAAPLTSLLFASFWPPRLTEVLGDPANSGPQIIGYLIGMFGLLVVTWVSDFFTERKRAREEQGK